MATRKNKPKIDRRIPVSNAGSPLEDFMAYAGELEARDEGGSIFSRSDWYESLSDSDKEFFKDVELQARVLRNLERRNTTWGQRFYADLSAAEIQGFIDAANARRVYDSVPSDAPNRNISIPKDEESIESEQESVNEYLARQEEIRDRQEAARAAQDQRAQEYSNAEEETTNEYLDRVEEIRYRQEVAAIAEDQRTSEENQRNRSTAAPAPAPQPEKIRPENTPSAPVPQPTSKTEVASTKQVSQIGRLKRPPSPAPAATVAPPAGSAETSTGAATGPTRSAAPTTEEDVNEGSEDVKQGTPDPRSAYWPPGESPWDENGKLKTEYEPSEYPDGSGGFNKDGSKKSSTTAKKSDGTEAEVKGGSGEVKEGSAEGSAEGSNDFQETLEALGPNPSAGSGEGSGPAEGSGGEEEAEAPVILEDSEIDQHQGENFNPYGLVNRSGDFDFVLYAQSMAVVESGGNRLAVSAGNAKGLYQFISSTWNELARKAGEWDPNGGEKNKKGKAEGIAIGRYKISKDSSDGRFNIDTSTEALVNMATGHMESMQRRKIEITYAHLYMYHCAQGLAPQEIKKALDPATAGIVWSADTLTPEQRAQWDHQSYWNPGYYYKSSTHKETREEVRKRIQSERDKSNDIVEAFKPVTDKEVEERYDSRDNRLNTDPRTWREIYDKKIRVMNRAVKAVQNRDVFRRYQYDVYVEIPKALNARGFYKLNNGQPVDPSLDGDLVPGAIGRSDGAEGSGSGNGGGSFGSNEWWRSGQDISEGETASRPSDTQRYIEKTIIEAIKNLPVKVTDTEANAFKKYQLQIQALYNQGWKLYEEDLTSFNLFYKEHSLSIICDDSNSFPLRGDSSPIICDFISGTSFNLFKKLPIQGIIIPTAQYLGKQDDTFLVSLRCNGLNSVKHIEVMRDTLKKQAILYKYIPSSFSLKVENNFINAFGNLYFVINGMESSTQPETPGSYAMEMRLTANNIVTKDTLINRESTVSTAEIKEVFLKEFATNAKGLIETNEAQAYPESSPDACAPSGSPPNEETLASGLPPTQSMMEEITEKRIHMTVGREILGYKNLVYFNEDEVSDWMSDESRFFLQELCAVINLCKCLIIPTGYHYATLDYKLKYPLHKKLIKILWDARPSILSSSLPVDQPLFWLKRHKGEVQYKNQPSDTRYTEYYQKAEAELENIAPVLWDYQLEYEHVEYDLSDSVLRASAFTSIDAEQYLPYARARAEWARMGAPLLPFLPYLAAHRAVNLMSNCTIFNYITDLRIRKPEVIGSGDLGPFALTAYDTKAASHFYLLSHYIARKQDSRYYGTGTGALLGFGKENEWRWWFTLNNQDIDERDSWKQMTVINTFNKEDANGILKKDIKWYLWPYTDRIAPAFYTTGLAWVDVKFESAGGGAGGAASQQVESYPLRRGRVYKEENPTEDTTLPYNQRTKPADADLVDASLMEYIWNYLIIPYINNALNYENIYLLATETNSFPKTLELISRQIQSKIQPTYNDLMLPKHPYWNEKDANALRGTAFTEPDFYLFNVSTESDFERNSERVEYVTSDNPLRGDTELHLSPEAAYNLSIQAEVETRMSEIEGLQQLDYDLNVKNKVIGKNNSTTYGKTLPKASRYEYYRATTAPKTILPTEPAVPQSEEVDKSVFIDPKTSRVEWADVALMFGENLDLVGSLSSNVGKDQKFLNSRLLNYAWQDYDAMSAENKLIELRQNYYEDPMLEAPRQPGTVAGRNPNRTVPKPISDAPGNKGAPFPDFDWSKQRVLVIGSSSAVGLGNRLGKNLGYDNKTAEAYLNIGIGSTAVRHWTKNSRHQFKTKWHTEDKKDENGNVVVHTEGKLKGKPVKIEVIDEKKIPIDELDKALLEFKPTIIHIVLGANDEAVRRPVNSAGKPWKKGEGGVGTDVGKKSEKSIMRIKEKLKDYITVWWIGPGSTLWEPDPHFRQILEDNWGPYYYDWTKVDPTFPVQYLTGDKIHLTPKGSSKWVEIFKQTTQDGIFKEGVDADHCITPLADPDILPESTPDGLPAPEQGDPEKTRMLSKFFQFWEEDEEGSGDTSPYMNFSNSRYPTYVKLKDAIKSVNRRKMSGRRAYPVCKVYFIEEDNIYNKETFELDEIYSYSEVESLEISDSRKRPASVAKITFLDPHGILSGYNQWAAAASPRFLQEKQNLRYNNSSSELQLSTESTLKGVRGSRYEQSDISFSLRAGLKIKICLGFSNDANKLSEVFLGEITDVNLDGSGDRIEVVALSYGAELAAVTKGVTEKEAGVEYNDTFDLLAHLMFEPEVIHFGKKKFSEVTMFGENQSLKTNQIQYKETFSRGGSMNIRRGTGLVNTFLAGWDMSQTSAAQIDLIDGVWDAWNRKVAEADKELGIEPFAGPQDDNIFAPNFLPSQGAYAYDWFARWQGQVSGDKDIRVMNRESKMANPVPLGASTTFANILGAGVGITIAAYTAMAVVYFVMGGLFVAAAGVLVIGAVLAVGLGILAAACVNFALNVKSKAADHLLNNKKVAEREGLANADGTPSADAPEKVDSPLLIHIYSPDELKYNIFHSTIWDVFQEMTLRHPGYVAQPRIYEKSNRMTMFFGLPDQNMWYTAGNPQDTIKANAVFKAMARDAEAYYNKAYGAEELMFNGLWGWGDGKSDGAPNDIQSFRAIRTPGGRGSENVFQDNNTGKLTVRADLLNIFLKYVRKRYKPFRRWHNVNSYTDIISNDIEASSQGWFTVVNIQYQYTRWWGVDSEAEDAAEGFEGRAKSLQVDDAAGFAEWNEDRVVKQKANLDLAPNYERTTTFQFLNAKSKGMAKTYGRAKLAHEAKEMYKGSLTVMGSPHIRPHDVVMLNDTYNNMYGPIEVEEVHHIFSPETGYITVLYPDTFIINEDVTPYLLWNGLSADVYNRTEFYMETALAAMPTWGDLQSISSKGRAYFAQLRDVILNYRRSAEKQDIEVEEVKDLFDTFSFGVGAAATVGSAITGYTSLALYGVGATILSGGLLLVGAAALGVAAMLYASYKLNDIILNYVSESRSYMIVPLMREGIPMVSGINITSSSGAYKTPLQYMRQYWMDGGQGRALEQTDTLMKYSYMYQRRGGDLNNWLARTDRSWNKFTLDWSSAFHDIPDILVQPALFGINKK